MTLNTRGNILRRLRHKKGVSGPVAAVGIGISPDTLNGLENDKCNPRESTLQAVAMYYGVALTDLFPPG